MAEYRTKDGDVITDEQIEQWAKEAWEGYDPDELEARDQAIAADEDGDE